MSEETAEDIIGKASAMEKEYEWLKASELYEQALGMVDEGDHFRRGEVQEKIGHSLNRAAFQAESRGEFRIYMQQVAEVYEKATELYRRTDDPKRSSAKKLHCKALISYIGFWLSNDPGKKRELLDECLRMEKESLKSYDGAEDRADLGKAYVALTNYLSNRLDLELDTIEREKILDEALSLGERAIEIFLDTGDERELAMAYCITGINCYNGAISYSSEKKTRECERKAFDYAKNAIRISERTGDKYILGRSAVSLGFIELDLGAGFEAAYELFKKALQYGTETKDHCITSEAYDGLAYSTNWSMRLAEDLENIREKSRQIEDYTNNAISYSTLADYGRGIPHSHYSLVTTYWSLARKEIELETRRELLEKAVTIGKQGLENALQTGSTHATYHLSNTVTRALSYLSTVKTEVEKKQLLEEAMTISEKAIYYTEQLRPYFMLARARYSEIARILFELSKLEENSDKRKELLDKSVSHMETNVTSLQRHIASHPPRREVFANLGSCQTDLGDILNQLYKTTAEKDVLRKIIETYKDSVQNYVKADLVNRAAEAYWKTAVAYDLLGEFLESASIFESASNQYESSSRNIPELNNFYLEYATYMQAWSEIERARHHHVEKRYGEAKEHYEKAAELHKATERWGYLSPNYLAWARVEEAEDLSRREQTQKARDLFQQAVELFSETEDSIKSKLKKIEVGEERQIAEELIKASDVRREYCLGRVALEEARILDRQGDHLASSRRYGSAAETFQRIAGASEEAKKELQPLVCLCQAWQKMTMAEAEASAIMYLEASKLFEEAKDHVDDERSKRLALGHSRFCRALEAGARFEDKNEIAYYNEAIKHLESAARHYVRAGVKSAADYAEATQRLFDAYVYMDNASKDTDPMKRARYYQMAEKVLETSAGSYLMAKHPEKSEEVQRLLGRVREKRELAATLSQVLHAPTTVSTTEIFNAPMPTREQAVGLDRFESADIQANFTARRREVGVGEDLDLEIELVNAGKAPAQLVKVEDIVIEGFELKSYPEICRVEDSYLDMKGRTLSPLKTQELKLVLKPLTKGVFELKPRILYLDESGKYKSHEPEPISIIVQELGIRGWLRGPTR